MRSKLDAKWKFNPLPPQTDRQRLMNRSDDDEILHSMPDLNVLASTLILPTTSKSGNKQERVKRGVVRTHERLLTMEQ